MAASGYPINGKTYGIATPDKPQWIGVVKGLKQDLKLAGKLQGWEHFVYETKEGKFHLKQVVSGYYLGLMNGKDEPVRLAERAEGHETFTLEPAGNRNFFLKNIGGLYISRKGDSVVLSTNKGNDELWKFDPVA